MKRLMMIVFATLMSPAIAFAGQVEGVINSFNQAAKTNAFGNTYQGAYAEIAHCAAVAQGEEFAQAIKEAGRDPEPLVRAYVQNATIAASINLAMSQRENAEALKAFKSDPKMEDKVYSAFKQVVQELRPRYERDENTSEAMVSACMKKGNEISRHLTAMGVPTVSRN